MTEDRKKETTLPSLRAKRSNPVPKSPPAPQFISSGLDCRVASLLAMTMFFLLAACGFSPIYGDRGENAPLVEESLSHVIIENIADRHGQILRNHLIDRLYVKGRPINPAFRLTVSLEAKELDLGIQKDAVASRRELSLWAPYSLKDLNGKALLSGKAHSVVSYSKLEAQYGTVTAQNNAYERALKEASEQIVNRLVLYFAESSRRTPTPDYPSFLLPK